MSLADACIHFLWHNYAMLQAGGFAPRTFQPYRLACKFMTSAVLDRLAHHCHVLEATGESYRLKDDCFPSKPAPT